MKDFKRFIDSATRKAAQNRVLANALRDVGLGVLAATADGVAAAYEEMAQTAEKTAAQARAQHPLPFDETQLATEHAPGYKRARRKRP